MPEIRYFNQNVVQIHLITIASWLIFSDLKAVILLLQRKVLVAGFDTALPKFFADSKKTVFYEDNTMY